MNPLDQLNINNRKFNNTRDFNTKFLGHVKQYAEPRDIPSEIKFLDDENLVVKGFGHDAKATPRFVKDKNEIFAVEYVFHVQTDDDNEKTEVFRFYLTDGGRIVKSLESNEPANNICDFNNENVSSHVCLGVLNGILHSSLFEPLNAIKE